MEESLLKNIFKNQDTLNIKYWEMSMVTMFICQKESAQSKEETKRLLKKLHAPLWMKPQERKWESKQSH
jgi:hypothetical protein